MLILYEGQFQYTPNHNEFDTCFVTCVFILIICDDSVKVFSTLKHLSRHSQKV